MRRRTGLVFGLLLLSGCAPGPPQTSPADGEYLRWLRGYDSARVEQNRRVVQELKKVEAAEKNRDPGTEAAARRDEVLAEHRRFVDSFLKRKPPPVCGPLAAVYGDFLVYSAEEALLAAEINLRHPSGKDLALAEKMKQVKDQHTRDALIHLGDRLTDKTNQELQSICRSPMLPADVCGWTVEQEDPGREHPR